MINILSPQSRKAWVGTATTILSPLVVLITSTDEPITWRVLIAAVLSGLVGGASVFSTKNAKPARAAVRPSQRGRHQAAEENSSPEGD